MKARLPNVQSFCPICSIQGVRSIGRTQIEYHCQSVFRHIEGIPRGHAIFQGERCIPSCGVCGEKLPHHVTACAGNLKRALERCS